MRWLTSVLSFFLVSSIPLQAQRVLVGVKGGLPGLKGFEGNWHYSSPRIYALVGPTVEPMLWRSLAVEADLLYHRMGYTLAGYDNGVYANFTTRVRANVWDLSLLGKYYFPGSRARAYVTAGWAFRTFSGVTGTTHLVYTYPHPGQPAEETFVVPGNHLHSPAGPASGVGLQFKAGRLRIGPEVRYTHWRGRAVEKFDKGAYFQATVNQLDFMLGLSF